MDPGFRVVSREIGESFERSFVAEAFEPCAIVVSDEVVDIGITLLGGREPAVMTGGIVVDAVEMFAETAIEAFDHAVGLRAEGLDQPMDDGTCRAHFVERMLARRLARRLAFLVDGEAIGPFPAIVCEDGVNRMREVRQKALKESACRGAGAFIEDLGIDIAGCPVDGYEGIGALAAQRGQVLDVEMDEAARRGLEGCGLWRGMVLREEMPCRLRQR